MLGVHEHIRPDRVGVKPKAFVFSGLDEVRWVSPVAVPPCTNPGNTICPALCGLMGVGK